MLTKRRATISDLYAVPDNRKAELVNGEIVLFVPTGDEPGYAGDEIFVALREYARRTGHGRAVGDNKGFQPSSGAAKQPTPNPPFPAGPCPSTTDSHRNRPTVFSV